MGEPTMEYTEEMIERAAGAAHEANRAYCQSIGDDSQVPWEEAPDWQRASCIAGARAIAEDPDTTPEQSHEGWLALKKSEGWVYGEVKDPEKKTHHCMVPYDQLPEAQRKKDSIFGDTVRASFAADERAANPPQEFSTESLSVDAGRIGALCNGCAIQFENHSEPLTADSDAECIACRAPTAQRRLIPFQPNATPETKPAQVNLTSVGRKGTMGDITDMVECACPGAAAIGVEEFPATPHTIVRGLWARIWAAILNRPTFEMLETVGMVRIVVVCNEDEFDAEAVTRAVDAVRSIAVHVMVERVDPSTLFETKPTSDNGYLKIPAGHIDVVFDGPPGRYGGRFVEVESDQGSIHFGQWVKRDDGYFVLRFSRKLAAPTLGPPYHELAVGRPVMLQGTPCKVVSMNAGKRRITLSPVSPEQRMPVAANELSDARHHKDPERKDGAVLARVGGGRKQKRKARRGKRGSTKGKVQK